MIPRGLYGAAIPPVGGSGSVSGAYVTKAASSANSASYTFSSLSIGAAATDRRVHVAVAVRKAAPAATITAVTIAGVSATQDVSNAQSGSTCAIWSAAVPTGTTGDVVVTTSATVLRCHVYVYRSTGASETPTGTSTPSEAQSGAFSLTSVADGFAIAVTSNTSVATVSWTGATGDAADATEFNTETGSTATTGTPTSITADWSSAGSAYAHAAVAYGPA